MDTISQNISCVLVDENGKKLESSKLNFSYIKYELYKMADFKDRFPWLSTIDDYQDTTFNTLQIPWVIRELKGLYGVTEDEELKALIKAFVRFLRRVSIHEYVKFVGD